MSTAQTAQLRAKREATVRAHAEAENRRSVEATLETFAHPRYEVMPLGAIHDGAGAVSELLAGLFSGFPDFHVDVQQLYHADDAVIVEVRMTGTQKGVWAGLPPSGKPIDVPMACIFVFEGENLVCEKVYFDLATLTRQIS